MNYDASIKFLPTVGIYMIQDKTASDCSDVIRRQFTAASRKGNYASRVAVYQDSMKKLIENRQEVLFGVKNGLDNREFVVYYQPQVSARTNRILGKNFEALGAMGGSPARSALPGEFIPFWETAALFISWIPMYGRRSAASCMTD